MSVPPWLYALLFIAVMLAIALVADRRAGRVRRAAGLASWKGPKDGRGSRGSGA